MKSIWERVNYDNEQVLGVMYDDVNWGRAPPALAEMKGEINRLLCMPPKGD